jgi:hypothetical protein
MGSSLLIAYNRSPPFMVILLSLSMLMAFPINAIGGLDL